MAGKARRCPNGNVINVGRRLPNHKQCIPDPGKLLAAFPGGTGDLKVFAVSDDGREAKY